MRIVFFGTPEYTLPILNSLHKTFKTKFSESPIVAVVTQKPKPTGRKKILTYSPVDTWAHKRKIPVYRGCPDLIKDKVEADLGVLVAYGEIIPKKVIAMFPHGILNAHPSLLPKFRGASPVQATVIAGDATTGVTIIKLDEQVDHGPIISQFKEEVLADDTTATLRQRLFEKSAEALAALVHPYIQDKITPRKQNHKKATFTTLIKKKHGFIPPQYLSTAIEGLTFKGQALKGGWKIPFIRDYSLLPSPHTLERFIRAMDPWPVAWTLLRLSSSGQAKRLKILKAHIKDNKLVLDEVQLEGKTEISWKQFRQGYATATFE